MPTDIDSGLLDMSDRLEFIEREARRIVDELAADWLLTDVPVFDLDPEAE